MRVCFLTHNLRFDNGAGVFSKILIEGIRARGYGVTALTTHPVGISYEKPILHPGKFRLVFSLFNVRKNIKSCDIVHALDIYPYGIIAVFASLGLKKPIVITAIGTGSIGYKRRWYVHWLMQWACRRADAVTAISRFTKNAVEKEFGLHAISVINHGVDGERFVKRRGLSLPERIQQMRPYVLSVGSLRWRKGYHRSIAAFTEVRKIFPSLHYVIIGKRYADDYYERIRQQIRDLDLEGSVHILDHVDSFDELADWYRGAELFCLCSQTRNYDLEGFGLVFLEAAASGLPVVGTTGSGIEDAVRNGVNGILVPAEDYQGFAVALQAVLNDPARARAMRQESLAFAERMTWDRAVEQYCALYEGLLCPDL